jgi:hypothetical protein
MDLSHNNLIGEMPEGIGNLINIILVNVFNNLFSGGIPVRLGHCSVLALLNMDGNNIQGSIPANMRMLVSIQYINLSRNYLSGTVPEFLICFLEEFLFDLVIALFWHHLIWMETIFRGQSQQICEC